MNSKYYQLVNHYTNAFFNKTISRLLLLILNSIHTFLDSSLLLLYTDTDDTSHDYTKNLSFSFPSF
eukprot:UN04434